METETRPATPIRLATADDVGALARVSRLAYAATYPDIVPADVLSEWIESAGATWQAAFDGQEPDSPWRPWVAERDGRIVGYATTSPGKDWWLPPIEGSGELTNLYLEPGPWAPEEILRSVGRGLYVTELIGFGVNFVTGDYSRGAVGFWIEDGELAYPVEEITIAGNLRTMLQDVEMVGRDLVFRDQTAAPTVKISRLTVAGQ